MTPVKRPERAVFAGLARDSAAMLPAVLGNLERMSGLFAGSGFLFLENGSRDDTRALLERWCAGRSGAAILAPDDPEAAHPQRTLRLAALRAQLVREAAKRFGDFDLLVIADCDDINARQEMDVTAFARAVDFLLCDPAHAGVFANTLGVYYDLWALRHPLRCPDDIWEASMDYALAKGVSDEAAHAAIFTPRIFSLPADAPPWEVDSAFGGLGIYRMSRVLTNNAPYIGYKTKTITGANGAARQVGWQMCEHVSFHAGLRAGGGRLFVLPWLVLGDLTGVTFPPSAWRGMIFDLAGLEAHSRAAPPVTDTPRNAACPCGSGRRYKHCHGALA